MGWATKYTWLPFYGTPWILRFSPTLSESCSQISQDDGRVEGGGYSFGLHAFEWDHPQRHEVTWSIDVHHVPYCKSMCTHMYIYIHILKSSVSQNHESWPFSCDGYPKNNKFAMGVNGCASLCSALEHGKHERASIGSFGFPNVQCNSMEWGWNLVALRNTGYWDMWWREMGLKIHLGWFG